MSEWKQDAAKRRDIRATKTDGSTSAPKPKKNTKKWCKGKEGREHVVERRTKSSYGSFRRQQDVCMNCGKIVKTAFEKWPWSK
jgi:hypothetical protein